MNDIQINCGFKAGFKTPARFRMELFVTIVNN